MDPNAQPSQQTQVSPPEGSKSNALLALISVFILLGVVGITLFLYLQNKTSRLSEVKTKETKNESNSERTIKVSQNQSTGQTIICRRYTSLQEALENPEIACVLDLSNQKLNTLPESLSTLKKLTEINLSNNNFTEFPTVLYDLPNIASINLDNNKVKAIPDMEKLTSIQIVSLKNNLIESGSSKGKSSRIVLK